MSSVCKFAGLAIVTTKKSVNQQYPIVCVLQAVEQRACKKVALAERPICGSFRVLPDRIPRQKPLLARLQKLTIASPATQAKLSNLELSLTLTFKVELKT